MTRAFYDGEGRLIETRAPGPNSQDIVTFAYYDKAGRRIFKSNPYFVAAYTGLSGPAAYSIPDSTQPGSSTTYTNLRQTSVTDPNSHTSTSTDSVVCGVAGTSDTGCYGQTLVAASLTGGLGKTNYKQTYTGASTYALYATTTMTYNAAGDLLSTKSPDGTTVTTTYDDLGHAVSQFDPDSGTSTAIHDPNGNVTQTVDARGSVGTIYAGYDGLNRQLWRNSTNSATGAWVTYSYDSTSNGNDGVGQLTSESFTGSGNLSGSYAYTYDARGQQIAQTTTVNGTNYQISGTYNDAGQLLTQTYPTGEIVTPGYSSTGWLTGLTTSAGGNTTIASNLMYTGLAGAVGQISSMSLGNGTYSYTASYDTGIRLTSAGLTNVSSGTQLYQTQPTYDAVSNIVGVKTSIGGQTDTQQFCYDDLSRLTWSGTSGTPPCSGSSISSGTLTGAQYQLTNSYNIDGGLITGPKGNYTYEDSSHPHAVTTTSSGYSASYDATGNLICRALTSATTCGASPMGQQLSYDAQGQLSTWQNQPTLPTQTVNYLYDGSGNRVAMQSTVNGTTTLTSYIGSIEEVQASDSSTQTTTYYAVNDKRVAADVNGTFYYFGYDALGSQVAVLDATGNLVGSQLYGPYGVSRYNTGTLPTSIGFTGQQTDSVTGLDYYVARYYDPVVGQFLSADSMQGNVHGMDPYAYVEENPETRIDPTGYRAVAIDPGDVSTAVDNSPPVDDPTGLGQLWGDIQDYLNSQNPFVAAAEVDLAVVTAPIWVPIALGVVILSIPSDSSRPSNNSGSNQSQNTSVSPTPEATPATNTNGAGARCKSNCIITRKYDSSYHQANSTGGASGGKSSMDLKGQEAQSVLDSAIPVKANSTQLIAYYNSSVYLFKFTQDTTIDDTHILRSYHGFKVSAADLNTELQRVSKDAIKQLVNKFGAPKQWLRGGSYKY